MKFSEIAGACVAVRIDVDGEHDDYVVSNGDGTYAAELVEHDSGRTVWREQCDSAAVSCDGRQSVE